MGAAAGAGPGAWTGAGGVGAGGRQAERAWSGPSGRPTRRYLHIVVARHSDADERVSSGFRAVEEYLALEETDQYTAANAELMTQLELLAEMEQPSLVNIF